MVAGSAGVTIQVIGSGSPLTPSPPFIPLPAQPVPRPNPIGLPLRLSLSLVLSHTACPWAGGQGLCFNCPKAFQQNLNSLFPACMLGPCSDRNTRTMCSVLAVCPTGGSGFIPCPWRVPGVEDAGSGR